jgi:hypothetical protein
MPLVSGSRYCSVIGGENSFVRTVESESGDLGAGAGYKILLACLWTAVDGWNRHHRELAPVVEHAEHLIADMAILPLHPLLLVILVQAMVWDYVDAVRDP